MISIRIKLCVLALVLFATIPASGMRLGSTIKRYRLLDITDFDPLKKLVAQGMELQMRLDAEEGGLKYGRMPCFRDILSEQRIVEMEESIERYKKEYYENAVELCNFFLTAEELNEVKDKLEAEIHEAAWWAKLFYACPLLMPEHIEQIEKMRQQQSKKD